MNKTTWVLVADEAIARILELSTPGHALSSVEEITDPLAHASGAELRRDAEGRRASGFAPGSRGTANVTASAGEGERHDEAEQFARRVAQHLEAAAAQDRFAELQVVAAPRFLGLLRKALPQSVTERVRREVDKDYVHFGNDDIAALLYPDPRKQ